jgi:hypothetical protein
MLAAMDAVQELEWAEKYRAAVQARTPEPVLAAATCSAHSDRLPPHLLLAVTPASVQAFAFRPRGFSIRLKECVASWAREGLHIAVREGALSTLLTLEDVAHGVPVVLSTSNDELSRRFLTELLRDAA